MTMWKPFYILLCICLSVLSGPCIRAEANNAVSLINLDSNHQSCDTIFLAATLDGKLHRINMENGDVIWSYKAGAPILSSTSKHRSTIFADPTDGTLYEFMTSLDTSQERLARYPYTVMELVAMCPMQIGSKHFLCSGYKKDIWLQLSPENGTVLGSLGVERDAQHCPNQGEAAGNASILLGRSELTLSLRDAVSHELLWDITLNTYHPNTLAMPKDYGYKHLSSSQDGLLVTLDKLSNEILWRTSLDSPVVGLYKVLPNRSVHRIDVRSFDQQTLRYLLQLSEEQKPPSKVLHFDSVPKKAILSTLYIGEGPQHMLYAMCSVSHDVDMVRNLEEQPVRRLISGPSLVQDVDEMPSSTFTTGSESSSDSSVPTPDRENRALVGHYVQPKTMALPAVNSRWQIAVHEVVRDPIIVPIDESELKTNQGSSDTGALTPSKILSVWHPFTDPVMTVLILLIFLVLVSLVCIAVLLYQHLHRAQSTLPMPHPYQQHPYQHLLHVPPGNISPMSSKSTTPNHSNHSSSTMNPNQQQPAGVNTSHDSADRATDIVLQHMTTTSGLVEVVERTLPNEIGGTTPSSWIAVGQMQFDMTQVLGQGAQGTRVFKGRLRDGRAVAVKRLLRDHQALAMHEYKHLMEHMDNEHVIKYHWNECSSQFFYIALDLCDGTLADYAKAGERAVHEYGVDLCEVLRQTCQGVHYLHSREVLHRDLKPKNVLLRRLHGNSVQPLYRVVISDFGLCKTFTRSGLGCSQATLGAGTMGWIAPEAMLGAEEDRGNHNDGDTLAPAAAAPDPATKSFPKGFVGKAADIFSLGCIFYYVASFGHHPFGEEHNRQYNITNNFPSLNRRLAMEEFCQRLFLHLVELMISHTSDHRPPAEDILRHPFFWTPHKQLQFICQVSNYLERNRESTHFHQLEKSATDAIRWNWLRQLPVEFVANLRDQRTYQGTSVSHLLRAIRNKHNHFIELPESVVQLFSGTQEGFLLFFLRRFPELLLHLFQWCTVFVSKENSFHEYLMPSLVHRMGVLHHSASSAGVELSQLVVPPSHCASAPVFPPHNNNSMFQSNRYRKHSSSSTSSSTKVVFSSDILEEHPELELMNDGEEQEEMGVDMDDGPPMTVVQRRGGNNHNVKKKRSRPKKNRPISEIDQYLAQSATDAKSKTGDDSPLKDLPS